MTELNREEAIKALECCAKASGSCVGCPLNCKCEQGALEENALSLIKKLTEENETLNLRLQTPLSPNNDMYIKNLETQIKKLTDENEVLHAINTLQEQDIADRDEMLNKKVEEVYPEFMRDYELLVKESEDYLLNEAKLEAQVRSDTARKMLERLKEEFIQYDDYEDVHVKTVRDCMTHIAQELIGGEGGK